VVIFDATPVLAVTDAVLLSRKMDGVLMVVAMKSTPREVVRQACEALRQAKANLLGVIANRADVKGRSAQYYEYYGEKNPSPARSSWHVKYSPIGALLRIFNRASN